MAQVNFLDQLVGEDGFGVAFGDQLTVVDDVGGFADIQGFTDVVVSDEYADALGFQVMNDLLDVAYRDRVYAGEGFVEQDELGGGGQCAKGRISALSAITSHNSLR